MRKWEKWLGIGVIIAVILTVVVSVYAAPGMSVSSAAEAVARRACRGNGGVSGAVEWTWGGGDSYRAEFECREGGVGSEWFECPMCFPV